MQDLGSGDTSERPIRLGGALVTMVEPRKGHEVAYNRWYERDHFYAGCMIGPWLFAGRRWVATRDLKDLRFPSDTPVLPAIDAGSYVAVYWILDDRYDDHVEWATEQVNWLYANERGFQDRTHALTAMYFTASRWYRDDDPVPLELALDHEQYTGMVSIVVQRDDGVSQEQLDGWFGEHLPAFLAGSPVANVSSWTPAPLLDSAPAFVPRDPEAARRTMALFFLEEDPRADWERFRTWAKEIDGSGLGHVVLCEPWIPTIIGTDTYTDQLW